MTVAPRGVHSRGSRARELLIAIGIPLAFAALVFGAAVSLYPKPPVIRDSYAYNMSGLRIAQSNLFHYGMVPADAEVVPNAFMTPGYPLTLAGIYAVAPHPSGESTAAVQAVMPQVQKVQFLFALLAVGFIAGSGFVLGGRWVGLTAGLIAGGYLPFAWASSVAVSENIGIPLVAAQLLISLLITRRQGRSSPALFVAFGFVSAAVALVRPSMALWAIVPLAFILIRRLESPGRLGKLAAFAAVGFLVLMAPWWIRNAVSMDGFIPLSTGAGNPMYLGTGGDPLTPHEELLKRQAEVTGRDWYLVVGEYRVGQQLRADPLRFIAGRLYRAYMVSRAPWLPLYDVYYEENTMPDQPARIALGPFPPTPPQSLQRASTFMRAYYLVVVALAAYSAAFLRRSPRLAIVLSVPVYIILVHLTTLFIPRYWGMAAPALVIAAAAGVVGVIYTVRHAVTKRAGVVQ